jgi:hypothetical protein
MITTTSTQPDLSLVKAGQQQTWASGEYTAVASPIVLVSELLAETADLHAGWRCSMWRAAKATRPLPPRDRA